MKRLEKIVTDEYVVVVSTFFQCVVIQCVWSPIFLSTFRIDPFNVMVPFSSSKEAGTSIILPLHLYLFYLRRMLRFIAEG